MWELDCKESWLPKSWCFWTVVLEKTLESLLDCKEMKPVHPKGDQSWVFIGRTDIEAETPVIWLPDVKSWLIWKDPGAWKDCRCEEKGTTEDEMVGWHHWLWLAVVHGVAKSWTWLSDWTELNCENLHGRRTYEDKVQVFLLWLPLNSSHNIMPGCGGAQAWASRNSLHVASHLKFL